MESTLETTPQSTPRYSEDVKEAILLAGKSARKAGRPYTLDRDYLRALLLSNRAFTTLDALFKQLGLSPKTLHKKLHEGSKTPYPDSARDEQPLPQRAERFAQSPPPSSRPSAETQVEHLLMALGESPDPLVQELMSQNEITPQKVAEAANRVHKSSMGRQVMFITRELAEVVVFVLFFLVLIKSFLGELRLIPSESMLPQLEVSDRVVIERVSRWYRPYERGDILVFYPPMTELKNDPWSVFLRLTGFSGLIYKKEDNIDVAYIKRLIALPGDRIEVRPGVGVFINGQKLDEPYTHEVADTCTLVQPYTVCQPITIPEGQFFMMGDNRNQSADSRYWGLQPDNRIIGRAVFRIWPPGRVGELKSPEYNTNKNNR